MNKAWHYNLKKELPEFLRKIKNELFTGVALGTIPVLLYSNSPRDLKRITESLLAADHLIDYAFYLLLIHIAISFIITRHFKTDSAIARINYLYKASTEPGGCFLTIIRTGLGAIVGYIVVTASRLPEGMNVLMYFSATYDALYALLIASCVGSFQDLITPKRFKSHYKNELILKIRP